MTIVKSGPSKTEPAGPLATAMKEVTTSQWTAEIS